MEHWHHWQHRVARTHAQGVWQGASECVQHRGSVAVQGCLWVARRTAGVTHAGSRILIKRWPLVGTRLRTDPGFVADQARNARIRWQDFFIAQRDEMLDRGAAAVNGLHNRQEAHVKTKNGIFSVVSDPGDLVWVKSGVQRMQHTSGAAHTKIQLQVPIAVPGECRHALTEPNIHAIKSIGHLSGAHRDILIGTAVNVTLNSARNDLAFAMVAVGKFDQRGNQ